MKNRDKGGKEATRMMSYVLWLCRPSRAKFLTAITLAGVILFVMTYTTHMTQYGAVIDKRQLTRNRSGEMTELDRFSDHISGLLSNFVNLSLHVEEVVNDDISRPRQRASLSMKLDTKYMETLTGLLKHQSELQAAPSFLLDEPIINDHTFSYLHNPYWTCSQNQTDVMFIVPSAPGNILKRMNVRKGIRGNYIRNPSNNAKLLFFLGRPPQGQRYLETQHNISEEAKMFGDVVQENFEDIYRNIRFKGIGMLKWVVTFCSQTQYVIRADDDVIVNPTKLVSTIKMFKEKSSDFILGRVQKHGHPFRNPRNKYYVSHAEFASDSYPPFAFGGLLGYPLSTAKLLYQAALRTPAFWLDDIYLTAFCATKAKIPLYSHPEFNYRHK